MPAGFRNRVNAAKHIEIAHHESSSSLKENNFSILFHSDKSHETYCIGPYRILCRWLFFPLQIQETRNLFIFCWGKCLFRMQILDSLIFYLTKWEELLWRIGKCVGKMNAPVSYPERGVFFLIPQSSGPVRASCIWLGKRSHIWVLQNSNTMDF